MNLLDVILSVILFSFLVTVFVTCIVLIVPFAGAGIEWYFDKVDTWLKTK